ncbi:hypothetical protein HOLleu_04188 [Holothuria leucospilota]|uniref:Uncharacterized protein n=1 Tax=Holothuria leucospilota TaxID=206669 RepID=A0A9Q1CRP8_HOLLE|nr:hypothetical protein HOLleu_04188 [Holothuria leucospilota]
MQHFSSEDAFATKQQSTLSTFFHYFCIDTTCNIQDLEEWANLETTELHSDQESEAPILICGERNRIYNNCQFTINRNDKESRRFREVYQEPAGSVRRRRVSTEANLDPNPDSASENESSNNAVTSLKNWLEQLGRDANDVYEICERIESHHNIVEQENIRLKRENDLLKQQIASTNTNEPPENDKDSPENDEDTPENDEDTPENDDATGGNQTYIDEETPLQRERHEGFWENICGFLQWLYEQGLSVLQSILDSIVSLLVGTTHMITAAQVS